MWSIVCAVSVRIKSSLECYVMYAHRRHITDATQPLDPRASCLGPYTLHTSCVKCMTMYVSGRSRLPIVMQCSRQFTTKLHNNGAAQSSQPLFLQRVSIACYAKRCTSYRKSVRPSVCLSVCLSQSGTVSKRLKLGSWDLHWRIAP